MALLLILALGLATLSTIELRRTGTTAYEAKAKARLALMLAIGELQRYAGPDTRATAKAGLLGDALPNPHWTGVWNTRGSDGKSLLKRDDRNGGLTDSRKKSGWNRETSALTWLASGAISPRTELDADGVFDGEVAQGARPATDGHCPFADEVPEAEVEECNGLDGRHFQRCHAVRWPHSTADSKLLNSPLPAFSHLATVLLVVSVFSVSGGKCG